MAMDKELAKRLDAIQKTQQEILKALKASGGKNAAKGKGKDDEDDEDEDDEAPEEPEDAAAGRELCSTVTLPPSTSLQPRSLAWLALLVYSLPQR